MDKEQLLRAVASEAKSCRNCPLGQSRRLCVPGEGNPDSPVMLVCEAPGREEDQQGRPFAGPAGQLLEGLLSFAGTQRSEVYITNVVKCRPPDNRDPKQDEIQACRGFLERQIAAVRPRLIVSLGRHATNALRPQLTGQRGKLAVAEGRLALALLHPAAALRRREWRTNLIQDFRQVAAVLDGKVTVKSVEAESAKPPEDAPLADRQGSLL